MATVAEECPLSTDTEELLYVRHEGCYRGWKVELLAEKLTGKIEETFLVCKVCGGLMRESSLFEIGGFQELRCYQCILYDVTKQPAQLRINREAINNKQVICPLKERGCEWSGLLKGILQHLQECVHLPVVCSLGCVALEGEEKGLIMKMERRLIAEHERDSCPLRKLECDFCNNPDIRAVDVYSHLAKCEEFPVPCPNDCVVELENNGQITRGNMATHLQTECPLESVACPYMEYGCEQRMERREVAQHEREYLTSHLKLTTVSTNKILTEQTEKIQKLETEIETKELEILKIETIISSLKASGRFVWRITGIKNKIQKERFTLSDPFNIGLYWCQVNICWDCPSEYIGCFINIVKGRYDDSLVWPFKYKLKLILFNQSGNGKNVVFSGKVKDENISNSPEIFQKPTEVKNKRGFGNHSFVSRAKVLKDKFNRGDSIVIGIEMKQITDW